MELSIITYNVLHFGDYIHQNDDEVDIKTFADYLAKKNADIVGFNEVYDNGPDEGYKNQVQNVAREAGYEHSFFAKALDLDDGYAYGNGLMSRYPFESSVTIVPDPPKAALNGEYAETRCVLRAEFNIEGKRLTVLDCHFGLNIAEQENAVKTVCDIVDSCDNDVVFMGDFNVKPDNEILKPIYDRFRDTADKLDCENKFTFPSEKPDRKIDYIMVRGNIEVVSATIYPDVVSDHLPVAVVVRL